MRPLLARLLKNMVNDWLPVSLEAGRLPRLANKGLYLKRYCRFWGVEERAAFPLMDGPQSLASDRRCEKLRFSP
jgi:hypothetical protein